LDIGLYAYYFVASVLCLSFLYPVAAYIITIRNVVIRIMQMDRRRMVFHSTYIMPFAGTFIYVYFGSVALTSIENFQAITSAIIYSADYKAMIFFVIVLPSIMLLSYKEYRSIFSRTIVLDDCIICITFSPFLRIIKTMASEIVEVEISKFQIPFLFDNTIRVVTARTELKMINVDKVIECYNAIQSIKGE